MGTGKGVIKFLGANQFRRQGGGGTEFIIVTEYCPGGNHVKILIYVRVDCLSRHRFGSDVQQRAQQALGIRDITYI